jgi:hypothetical protein
LTDFRYIADVLSIIWIGGFGPVADNLLHVDLTHSV